MDCRAVRLQIEEAELGWSLSSDLSAHFQQCADCQSFFEERTKLRELVGSLGQVKAPADFDFRLRARLAEPQKIRSLPFGISLGIPTAAAAALVLIVGGLLFFRSSREAGPGTATEVVRSEDVSENAITPAKSEGSNNTVAPAIDETLGRHEPKPRPQVAVNKRTRPGTREFSSVPAPVMKQDELPVVSSSFPIDTSQHSLKLSLDDGTGVYRTISVPRVSFGSQRSFGEQSPFVKASSNGDW